MLRRIPMVSAGTLLLAACSTAPTHIASPPAPASTSPRVEVAPPAPSATAAAAPASPSEAIPPAKAPEPAPAERFALDDPHVSFTAPSAAWHQKNLEGEVSNIGFEREPVFEPNGQGVLPYCSTLSVPTKHTDIVQFSLEWRLKQPFTVDSVFSHEDGTLKLKNAIGYWGKTTYGGNEHTLMIVHGLFERRGLIVVCDATTAVIDQVRAEFEAFLGSFEREPAAT